MSDITYDNKVEFRPLVDVFTQGYISMENYVGTIPDKNVTITSTGFALPSNMTIINFEDWKDILSKHSEFHEVIC